MQMNRGKRGLPIHTFLGVAVLLASQTLLWFRMEPVYTWFTPIVWWGFILMVDGLNYRLAGNSWLMNRRQEFAILALASVVCWLVFEFYNIYLEAWHYIGIPPTLPVRYTAYALSFATIWPALFEAAELLDNLGLFRAVRGKRISTAPATQRIMLYAGALMVAVPLLFPIGELIPLVWVGFVLFLDPINYRNNSRSLLRLLEKGRGDYVLALGAGGLLCGFLWEFWNFWAGAKWVYTVPYTPTVRYFEMPVAGLLGFIPFAWEAFAMYSTVLWTLGREGTRRKDDLVRVYVLLALLFLAVPYFYGNSPPDWIRSATRLHAPFALVSGTPDLVDLESRLHYGTVEERLDALHRLASLDTSEAMRRIAPLLAAPEPVLREEAENYFRSWSRRHRFAPLHE